MTITTDTTLLHDPRRQAALLYWQGFSVPQIAAMLQMKRPTVQSWKQRDGWDSVAPISRVEMSLEARLTQLIIKPQKTGGDFKEIDLLGRQIERLARVKRYSQTGNEADLNPNVATSVLMPPASVSACSSSCARSIPPRVISATHRK
ncbi:terminase gpP N-terminus-related DNA-binding protein [Escherichia coli]|uniref:terminase gpP N-terminus-related DNA-binding protein n=1 Tax=Escherichia coli TaxID=562 RepID=UPI003A5C7B7D